MNRSKQHTGEKYARLRKSKPYDMGLQVVGYIKGKSVVYVARKYEGREKYFSGQHIWARGYFVSTVGMNEEVIRNQESEDRKTDQDLGLFPELG